MTKNTKLQSLGMVRSIAIAGAMTVATVMAGQASAQITFEEVFANPDNAQLNLDYAKQEAESGNLLQAGSTLERLLYAEPNWDSARLFYAYVLLQLDDRQGAERELDLLEGRPLNGQQEADLRRYQAAMRGDAASTSGSEIDARIKVGVRYDDNGANALTDVVNRTGDKDDVSLVARGSFTARAPMTAGLDILGGGSVYLREPSEDTSRSYRNLAANIGVGGGDNIEWSARFGARLASLDGDSYLTELGPRAGVSFPLSEDTKLSLGGAAVYQEYDSLPGLPNERFRSGQKYSLSGALSRKLSPQTRIGASLRYDYKDAKTDIFAYDAIKLGGNIFHTLNTDKYVRGDISYRNVSYDGVNGFVTPPRTRDDDHIYARAAYGVRLSALADAFSSADNVFLEGAVDVIDRSSNISAFDYDNVGAELSLTWDF